MTVATPHAVTQRRPALVAVDGRTYPLDSAEVVARAEGGMALTRLQQRFGNPHAEPLEVLYTMPLPADGAALGYTVRVGERVIRGEVQGRKEAEAAYREALYQGRTAGLLEQDRADTFNQRLGNIPPGTPVEVEIEVLHPLAFLPAAEAAPPRWEYRFPTVVGVRYQGAPGRVPDTERLDPDRGRAGEIPARVGLTLTVPNDDGFLLELDSPSHELVTEPIGEGALARLARDERLDRDLVVRWRASTGEVGVRLVEGGGLEGDTGRYALLTIVPPEAPRAAFRRDLTVLLDASGSMHGEPLELAKEVVGRLLRSLGPGDRFELLAFATDVQPLTRRHVDATHASVQSALEALSRLEAGGATEMRRAFERALASLRRDSQRQVVLVTDGHIGFESEVIGVAARSLPPGVRVHTVGVGSAPNRTLTTGLARAGRGVEVFAADGATAKEACGALCAATARPVLTDLVVGGSAVLAAAPERPRDVFAGRPVVVTAELMPEGGALVVEGVLAGASEPWVWRTEVPAADAPVGFAGTPLPVGALHGREAIADLEVHVAAGEGAHVEGEIEARGLRHRIASRFTSLVAIAEEPSVDPRAPRRKARLAVEVPAGVSAEGVGLGGVGVRHALASRRGPFLHAHPDVASPRPVDTGLDDGGDAFHELYAADLAPGFAAPSRAPGRPRALHVPSDLTLTPATVLRVDGDLLVVELETPYDGFELPAGTVEVGGKRATVVPEESSPSGPHDRGLWVRLALRLTTGETWPAGRRLEIRWSGLDPLGLEPAWHRLAVEIPARGPEGR